MQCPRCTHEIDENYFPLGITHCPYCGERVNEKEPDDFIPFCSSCGERLLTKVSFCPRCGKSTAPAPSVAAKAMPEEFSEVTPPVAAKVESPAGKPTQDVSAQPCYLQPKQLPARHEPVWPKIGVFFSRLARPVKERVSGEGKLEKLYQSWSDEAGLPPEEIPSAGELKTISRQVQVAGQVPPLRLQTVLLVGLGVVVIFVAIGFLIRASLG